MNGEVMLTCHITFQSDKFTRGQWDCCYCSRHSNTLPTRGLVMEINAREHANICFLLKGKLHLDHNYLKVASTTTAALPFRWNVFTLQLGSISCGALRSHSQLLARSSPTCSAEGGGLWWKLATLLIELWLTCCHGNSLSPTKGQKCFVSPCTTQTGRKKCPTG